MTKVHWTIEADARLRAKNQLTLPEPIADALGARRTTYGDIGSR